MQKCFWFQSKDTGELFAMKVLNKSKMKGEKDIKRLFNEREIIKNIDCPFIVKLYYTFQTTTKAYFILDLLNGGDLYTHIIKNGPMKEDSARFYAAEIALALEHLHDQNIVFRDLKPQNIIIDKDGHIKLADFGLSKKDFDQELDNTI